VIQAAGRTTAGHRPVRSRHQWRGRRGALAPRKRDLLSGLHLLVQWPEIESQCQGIAGITPIPPRVGHPTARNSSITRTRLESLRFLIRDRDTKYTTASITCSTPRHRNPQNPRKHKGNSHCEASSHPTQRSPRPHPESSTRPMHTRSDRIRQTLQPTSHPPNPRSATPDTITRRCRYYTNRSRVVRNASQQLITSITRSLSCSDEF